MRIRSWIMTAAMSAFVIAAPATAYGAAAPVLSHAPRLKLAPPYHA